MAPPAVQPLVLLHPSRAAVPGASDAEALPCGVCPGWLAQQLAGGRISFPAVEAAGMAVMGEVGDAQAKNIHTAEKFEKKVRK